MVGVMTEAEILAKLTDVRLRLIKLYAELDRGHHRQEIARADHAVTGIIADLRQSPVPIEVPRFLQRQGE